MKALIAAAVFVVCLWSPAGAGSAQVDRGTLIPKEAPSREGLKPESYAVVETEIGTWLIVVYELSQKPDYVAEIYDQELRLVGLEWSKKGIVHMAIDAGILARRQPEGILVLTEHGERI